MSFGSPFTLSIEQVVYSAFLAEAEGRAQRSTSYKRRTQQKKRREGQNEVVVKDTLSTNLTFPFSSPGSSFFPPWFEKEKHVSPRAYFEKTQRMVNNALPTLSIKLSEWRRLVQDWQQWCRAVQIIFYMVQQEHYPYSEGKTNITSRDFHFVPLSLRLPLSDISVSEPLSKVQSILFFKESCSSSTSSTNTSCSSSHHHFFFHFLSRMLTTFALCSQITSSLFSSFPFERSEGDEEEEEEEEEEDEETIKEWRREFFSLHRDWDDVLIFFSRFFLVEVEEQEGGGGRMLDGLLQGFFSVSASPSTLHADPCYTRRRSRTRSCAPPPPLSHDTNMWNAQESGGDDDPATAAAAGVYPLPREASRMRTTTSLDYPMSVEEEEKSRKTALYECVECMNHVCIAFSSHACGTSSSPSPSPAAIGVDPPPSPPHGQKRVEKEEIGKHPRRALHSHHHHNHHSCIMKVGVLGKCLCFGIVRQVMEEYSYPSLREYYFSHLASTLRPTSATTTARTKKGLPNTPLYLSKGEAASGQVVMMPKEEDETVRLAEETEDTSMKRRGTGWSTRDTTASPTTIDWAGRALRILPYLSPSMVKRAEEPYCVTTTRRRNNHKNVMSKENSLDSFSPLCVFIPPPPSPSRFTISSSFSARPHSDPLLVQVETHDEKEEEEKMAKNAVRVGPPSTGVPPTATATGVEVVVAPDVLFGKLLLEEFSTQLSYEVPPPTIMSDGAPSSFTSTATDNVGVADAGTKVTKTTKKSGVRKSKNKEEHQKESPSSSSLSSCSPPFRLPLPYSGLGNRLIIGILSAIHPLSSFSTTTITSSLVSLFDEETVMWLWCQVVVPLLLSFGNDVSAFSTTTTTTPTSSSTPSSKRKNRILTSSSTSHVGENHKESGNNSFSLFSNANSKDEEEEEKESRGHEERIMKKDLHTEHKGKWTFHHICFVIILFLRSRLENNVGWRERRRREDEGGRRDTKREETGENAGEKMKMEQEGAEKIPSPHHLHHPSPLSRTTTSTGGATSSIHRRGTGSWEAKEEVLLWLSTFFDFLFPSPFSERFRQMVLDKEELRWWTAAVGMKDLLWEVLHDLLLCAVRGGERQSLEGELDIAPDIVEEEEEKEGVRRCEGKGETPTSGKEGGEPAPVSTMSTIAEEEEGGALKGPGRSFPYSPSNISSFHSTPTSPPFDAGRQMNIQLRVCYVLKRLIHWEELAQQECKKLLHSASFVNQGDAHQGERASPTLSPSSSGTPFLLHPQLFPFWDPSRSSSAWANFFLIMETANEYNLHIVLPALKRLDKLVHQCCSGNSCTSPLDGSGSGDDVSLDHQCPPLSSVLPTTTTTSPAPISSKWVELLLVKLLHHPNTGVRKVTLRRLWHEWPEQTARRSPLPEVVGMAGVTNTSTTTTTTPPPVLPRSSSSSYGYTQAFSLRFLFSDIFLACSDARLCGEMERLPISTNNVLEMRAFEWEEPSPSLACDPISTCVEKFYIHLFRERARTAEERRLGLCWLLRTVQAQNSRFTISMFARLFAGVAVSLYEEAVGSPPTLGISLLEGEEKEKWGRDLEKKRSTTSTAAAGAAASSSASAIATLSMILDRKNIHLFFGIFREQVQDHVPYWLEVRLSAIFFTGFMYCMAIHPESFHYWCDDDDDNVNNNNDKQGEEKDGDASFPFPTLRKGMTPRVRRERRGRPQRGVRSCFWRLVCHCGPLGLSGGHACSKLDSAGQLLMSGVGSSSASAGASGSGLDPSYFARAVVSLSSLCPPALPPLLPSSSVFSSPSEVVDCSSSFRPSSCEQASEEGTNTTATIMTATTTSTSTTSFLPPPSTLISRLLGLSTLLRRTAALLRGTLWRAPPPPSSLLPFSFRPQHKTRGAMREEGSGIVLRGGHTCSSRRTTFLWEQDVKEVQVSKDSIMEDREEEGEMVSVNSLYSLSLAMKEHFFLIRALGSSTTSSPTPDPHHVELLKDTARMIVESVYDALHRPYCPPAHLVASLMALMEFHRSLGEVEDIEEREEEAVMCEVTEEKGEKQKKKMKKCPGKEEEDWITSSHYPPSSTGSRRISSERSSSSSSFCLVEVLFRPLLSTLREVMALLEAELVEVLESGCAYLEVLRTGDETTSMTPTALTIHTASPVMASMIEGKRWKVGRCGRVGLWFFPSHWGVLVGAISVVRLLLCTMDVQDDGVGVCRAEEKGGSPCRSHHCLHSSPSTSTTSTSSTSSTTTTSLLGIQLLDSLSPIVPTLFFYLETLTAKEERQILSGPAPAPTTSTSAGMTSSHTTPSTIRIQMEKWRTILLHRTLSALQSEFTGVVGWLTSTSNSSGDWSLRSTRRTTAIPWAVVPPSGRAHLFSSVSPIRGSEGVRVMVEEPSTPPNTTPVAVLHIVPRIQSYIDILIRCLAPPASSRHGTSVRGEASRKRNMNKDGQCDEAAEEGEEMGGGDVFSHPERFSSASFSIAGGTWKGVSGDGEKKLDPTASASYFFLFPELVRTAGSLWTDLLMEMDRAAHNILFFLSPYLLSAECVPSGAVASPSSTSSSSLPSPDSSSHHPHPHVGGGGGDHHRAGKSVYPLPPSYSEDPSCCDSRLPRIMVYSTHEAAAFLAKLEDFLIHQLDTCWSMNLPCVYDLLIWMCGLPFPSADALSSEGEEEEERENRAWNRNSSLDPSLFTIPQLHRGAMLEAMCLHRHDVGAKQQARLSAMLYGGAVRLCLPYDPERVLSLLKEELPSVGAGEEIGCEWEWSQMLSFLGSTSATPNTNSPGLSSSNTKPSGQFPKEKKKNPSGKHNTTPKKKVITSPRDAYYAASSLALAVLEHCQSTADASQAAVPYMKKPWWWWGKALRPLLLYWAVIYSPDRDNENEFTQAATEAAVARHWPCTVRWRYPASVNVSLLGRTLCVSALLWYMQQHPLRPLPDTAPSSGTSTAEEWTCFLLWWSTTHPLAVREPCMPNSETHRVRIRLWQLVCALQPFLLGYPSSGCPPTSFSDPLAALPPLPPPHSIPSSPPSPTPTSSHCPESIELPAAMRLASAQRVLEMVAGVCMYRNNLGSVRRLMEIYAIQLLHAYPSLFWVLEKHLSRYNELRPQVMGTFVLVAGHALLAHEKRLWKRFLQNKAQTNKDRNEQQHHPNVQEIRQKELSEGNHNKEEKNGGGNDHSREGIRVGMKGREERAWSHLQQCNKEHQIEEENLAYRSHNDDPHPDDVEDSLVDHPHQHPDRMFEVLFPRLVQQSSSHQHLLRIISHVAIYRIGKARLARLKAEAEATAQEQEKDMTGAGYVESYPMSCKTNIHTKSAGPTAIQPSFSSSMKERRMNPEFGLPSGMRELVDYIEMAHEHIKFREKHEEMLFYNTAKMASPRSIFCLQRREAHMVLCDAVPAAFFERMQYMEYESICLMGGGARFAFNRFRLQRLLGGGGEGRGKKEEEEYGEGFRRNIPMMDSRFNFLNSLHRPLPSVLLRRAFSRFPFIPHTPHVTNCCADFTAEAIEALWSDPLGEKVKSMNTAAASSSSPSLLLGRSGESTKDEYPSDAHLQVQENPAEWNAGQNNSTNGNTKQEAEEKEEVNVQRKTLSWWNSEVHNQLHPGCFRQSRPKQAEVNKGEGEEKEEDYDSSSSIIGASSHSHSMVVIASLLENPVNIAGLCRCADIFAIEQLVIPDVSVFAHPHFVAVARSAEQWVPWTAVPPGQLPAYFAERREMGYTIVGIEQTTQSIPISEFHFPKKSVMVLGSEGHGIPPSLIPLLDVCVEIPQYGLVRSLNVHVTGALSMYEYVLQAYRRR